MNKNYFMLASTEEANVKDWSKTKSKEISVKVRKTRANAPSHFVIFEKCLKMEIDKKWKRYFKDASNGIFPVKFSFDGKLLKHKNGNKIESVRIPPNPKKAAKIFIEFLGETEGIYHRTDKKDDDKEVVKLTWSLIRKSIQKEMAISTFITRKTMEMTLNRHEKSNLEAVINRGIFIGCFNNDSIIFHENRIESFVGLNFDKKTRKFYIDFSQINFKKRNGNSSQVKKKMTCDDKWFEFHAKLYEQMKKSEQIVTKKKRTKK